MSDSGESDYDPPETHLDWSEELPPSDWKFIREYFIYYFMPFDTLNKLDLKSIIDDKNLLASCGDEEERSKKKEKLLKEFQYVQETYNQALQACAFENTFRKKMRLVIPPIKAKKVERFFEFHKVRNKIKLDWIYCDKEMPETVISIRAFCKEAGDCCNCVDFITHKTPWTSREFIDAQNKATNNVKRYLINVLRYKIATKLKENLSGRGHLSDNVTYLMNYDRVDRSKNLLGYEEMASITKFCRVLRLIQFFIEDALRKIFKRTVNKYVSVFENPFGPSEDLSTFTRWGDDVNSSPLTTPLDSHFLITLTIKDEGNIQLLPIPTRYSFAALACFDRAVFTLNSIPKLDNLLLPRRMYYSDGDRYACIGAQEEYVISRRERIRKGLLLQMIPLQAYAKEFEKYLPLYFEDPDTVVETVKATYPLVEHWLAEIESQAKIIKFYDKEIPNSMQIGYFVVDCTPFKQCLKAKKQEIMTKHMDFMAARLYANLTSNINYAMSMVRRLMNIPKNVESLVKLKGWIEQDIPQILLRFEVDTEECVKLFGTLQLGYKRKLSQAESEALEESDGWPIIIESEIDSALIKINLTAKRLLKRHADDEGRMVHRPFYLKQSIDDVLKLTDLSKAESICTLVLKVWDNIEETIDFSSKLNLRQNFFHLPTVPYVELPGLQTFLEPFKDLWILVTEWEVYHKKCINDPILSVDPSLDLHLDQMMKKLTSCSLAFTDYPDHFQIAADLKETIEEFKTETVPILEAIRNPGMRSRHWRDFYVETRVQIVVNNSLTFKDCESKGLTSGILREKLLMVVDSAANEFMIETKMSLIRSQWEEFYISILPFKTSGSFIVKIPDEAQIVADEHLLALQQLTYNRSYKRYAKRIFILDKDIKLIVQVIEEWVECQKKWMYLQPVFTSEDMLRDLPYESRKFSIADRAVNICIQKAQERKGVWPTCNDPEMLKDLVETNKLLDVIIRALAEFLETKRLRFPRLFFLSDDELIEILSQAKDPMAVQPHLKKCFENINELTITPALEVTEMISGEGEHVQLTPTMTIEGNVEYWLLKVEEIMRETLRNTSVMALANIEEIPRPKWVLQWPGQIVIAGSQTFWTSHVEIGIERNTLEDYYYEMIATMDDLRGLIKGPLKSVERQVMSALIVIEVHARDVLSTLVNQNVSSTNDFDWISQLRYYLVENELKVRAVNAEFQYGYEYLGNSGRLVITPLTDRCYLTLTGALHLGFGGAPSGPAGTGKTESTKDLAKALAIQCVVFNCSDQLDYKAMGKFFKGLASTGAWACFDEFNRIDIEVLSVIAQQIMTIQKAQVANVETFIFEGTEIPLKESCAVFITMNPGYAGRTELPDNLKALFRPVAMMVPDYTLITEISLFSFGFSDAKTLAGKITTTFKLSSEQLSAQDHYDFGMRAVKTVIAATGNLKRDYPDMDEKQIVLRALKEVNLPKFLKGDLKLFSGIICDLFPAMVEVKVDYGELERAIREVCFTMDLQDVSEFVSKVIQLYETTVVRHGLMLVGLGGSGKTKCYEVLKDAMTLMHIRPVENYYQPEVETFILNPKSISMGQLYGEFDFQTNEWSDGILPTMMRIGTASVDDRNYWYIFDGPVDAVWIENMNTVLDDNKKLCLTSGEIIKLTPHMRLIYEVADLAVASPATVSRCGMVYLEPSVLGLEPFVKSWIKRLKPWAAGFVPVYRRCLSLYTIPSIEFLRKNMKEIVASLDSSLLLNCLNFLDIPLNILAKTYKPPFNKLIAYWTNILIPCWVLYSTIWSIGATSDSDSRAKYSVWLRQKMEENKEKPLFPPEGLVYDYDLYDGGLTVRGSKPTDPEWIPWKIPAYTIGPNMRFTDIEVPTIDNVRSAAILGKLVSTGKNTLCVGPTGTAKTTTVHSKLSRGMGDTFVCEFMNFSARTSVVQIQDQIESKLVKRKKGVFGPTAGKKLVLFIDDFNMPAPDTYGAQPPIELIRQWMDFGGWFDRHEVGLFRYAIDMTFVAGMGPPGGGKNPVTGRLLRHFHFLAFPDLSEASKHAIFGTILSCWLVRSTMDIEYVDKVLHSTLEVYKNILKELLPTPEKMHYSFNLRDLSKVFQGMLLADPKTLQTEEELLRLWYHENCRVFQDRLVNNDDRQCFTGIIKAKLLEYYGTTLKIITHSRPVFYVDFLPPVGKKLYQYVQDQEELIKILTRNLNNFNKKAEIKMNLVLFMDAISHACRIIRVINQPLGNALLLGMAGSGRRSSTKLAAFVCSFSCFQIESKKSYTVNDWRDDLKALMIDAGAFMKNNVFLFSDTQIKYESFLEDLNNILNTGDVPNMYQPEDYQKITEELNALVLRSGLPPTRANILAYYLKRVRANLHCVIAMSPIGEIFRARIRQFPALVNCCTIDWYGAWPDAALKNVACQYLESTVELKANPSLLKPLVYCCMSIHQSVIEASNLFLLELSRHNYITPTCYLQLLLSFNKMIDKKRDEMNQDSERLLQGLYKIELTTKCVQQMQIDIKKLQPELVKAQAKAKIMVKKIETDKIIAEKITSSVMKEEANSLVVAEKTKELEQEAKKDLAAALPLLMAAEQSLKALNKGDISEVKSLKKPPTGVVLVIEAICILKGVNPIIVKSATTGKPVPSYWEPARGMLADPGLFLSSLLSYDKESLTENLILKIAPYVLDPSFTPDSMKKVSKACTSLCSWVHAVYKYYYVNKAVAPKRQALKEAQEKSEAMKLALKTARAKLAECQRGVMELEKSLAETIQKKEDLEAYSELCKARMLRAFDLLGGLSLEKIRWTETVISLKTGVKFIAGDILKASASVAYLGPFTDAYRRNLLSKWISTLSFAKIPHEVANQITQTLGEPVKIMDWNMHGLPRDRFSVENAVLMDNSERWPLFIDPQGQANKWIKSLYTERGFSAAKYNDPKLLRMIETCIIEGNGMLIENIGNELDPSLDTILMKATYHYGKQLYIRFGESVLPYNENFKLYMTTSLPNPHYTPEIAIKVLVVNFALVPSGLQDQMLAHVVMLERPDLEESRRKIISSNAQMKIELKNVENTILGRLSSSKGNPVDDIELIETLKQSKIISDDIKVKVEKAAETELAIDKIRVSYVPVARRAQVLYFCVADLAKIDPMYQYSLEWFTKIFSQSIATTEKTKELDARSKKINDHFTFSMYSNVCRSLFEKNKLQFAFLLCVRILLADEVIDLSEWTFFLAGGSPMEVIPNPDTSRLTERSWGEILSLENMPNLVGFVHYFTENVKEFDSLFQSSEPHRETFPTPWDVKLTKFQQMMVIKCLRPEKITNCMQDYISENLGGRFIEPQTSDLEAMYGESGARCPLIFVLSSGADPAAELYKFADLLNMSEKLDSISLGQGQGPLAEALFEEAIKDGNWVFFQNCHLAPSWMPRLEMLIEEAVKTTSSVSPEFRLWLTSIPTPFFPASILQNGSKMTFEPPRGMKANLLRSYNGQVLEFEVFMRSGDAKAELFKKLLYSLCQFHGVCLERRKYGPLGFNIPYDFTDGDLRICISQLNMFLMEYSEIPFRVLTYTAGQINYGGRVTDDWDRRCIMTLLQDYYRVDVLTPGYSFDEAGVYKTLPEATSLDEYMFAIQKLPVNDYPGMFGLHENADISYAQAETFTSLEVLLSLQPKVIGKQSDKAETSTKGMAMSLLAQMPKPFSNINYIMRRYPVSYKESLNTVLVQEVTRFNKLLEVINSSLQDLTKALCGLEIMSDKLEKMADSLLKNIVPAMWASKAYPSLKPLGSWMADLQLRIQFIKSWIDGGIPSCFWISGFYFPQAFLTACLQNYARAHFIAIDSLAYKFMVLKEKPAVKPKSGCVVYGLFLEGAIWNPDTNSLEECIPKVLYTAMNPIWFHPDVNHVPPPERYPIPVYKTLKRAGTLSTTGHSTNYVLTIEINTNVAPSHWIKRGTALFCALDY